MGGHRLRAPGRERVRNRLSFSPSVPRPRIVALRETAYLPRARKQMYAELLDTKSGGGIKGFRARNARADAREIVGDLDASGLVARRRQMVSK